MTLLVFYVIFTDSDYRLNTTKYLEPVVQIFKLLPVYGLAYIWDNHKPLNLPL